MRTGKLWIGLLGLAVAWTSGCRHRVCHDCVAVESNAPAQTAPKTLPPVTSEKKKQMNQPSASIKKAEKAPPPVNRTPFETAAIQRSGTETTAVNHTTIGLFPANRNVKVIREEVSEDRLLAMNPQIIKHQDVPQKMPTVLASVPMMEKSPNEGKVMPELDGFQEMEPGGIPNPVEIIPAESLVPATGHSKDYRSLSGEVYRWQDTWRLRYSPIDVEDCYGGCVILLGRPHLANLQEGQHIRVQGQISAPGDRLVSAEFQIESLEILNPRLP